MRSPRLLLTAALARATALGRAAALATALTCAGAALAGCGSSAAPASDPMRALSASAIAAKAVDGTEAASGMRVAGQNTTSGQSLSFNLAVDSGKGCQGTVTESGDGTFKLVELGTTVWVQPNDAFYKTEAARGAVVPLAALSGKYLKETSGKSALGSFGNLCQLNPLLTAFKSAKFAKGPVTAVGGTRALRLSGGSANLYVTDTASPRVARISAPGTTYDFTGYGDPAGVSAPPADQVADGSQYGF